MNNKALAIRLTGTILRIRTLIERMEEIRDNGRPSDYNGYIPGYNPDGSFKSNILSDLEENTGNGVTPIEHLLDFISENYTENDGAWSVLYHLTNVKCVIKPYFNDVCGGRYNPSKDVLDCDINGCKMVVDVLEDIVSKLKETK